VAEPIIETLRDGGWVYISARTPEWEEHVAARRCDSRAAADEVARAE
jgi:hypothetical protein